MTQIPDLLRRFVTTPHRAVVSSGKRDIAIESNERAITTCVTKFITACRKLDSTQRIRLVRIVRDSDVVSDGKNLACVHSGPIVALLRGSTTSFYMDVALGELLGFLASDVDIKELEQRLLPALLSGSIPTEFAHSNRDDKQVTSTASARDNLSSLTN